MLINQDAENTYHMITHECINESLNWVTMVWENNCLFYDNMLH